MMTTAPRGRANSDAWQEKEPEMNRTLHIAAGAATMQAIASQAAHAHVGVSQTTGFVHGLGHPLGGLDHILAMVMVGILAAQIGGRALWLVPGAFVAAMVPGGIVGTFGFEPSVVELGIGLSIAVLGGVVALRTQLDMGIAMAVVGFFGLFHGFAHGAEMPSTGSGLGYGAGFVLATGLLHAVGLGFGLALSSGAFAQGRQVLQAIGGGVALAGAAILTGLV